MFFFDLRSLLFVLLLIITGLLVLAIWLDRRSRHQHLLPPLPGKESLLPVLEQAPFGYLILKDAQIRYANACARHLLDLTSTDASLPEATWVTLLAEDREMARQETTSLGRYRHVPLSFNQFVQWWVFRADELDILFVLDVTAQQRAKQTSQFLFSGFSHELRTPIATILTHLEVLSVPNIAEEIRQQSVHLLKQEAQRMTRLVNQMLTLGRLETEVEIEHRPVDLLSLIEETVFQVTPLAEKQDMTISLESDTALPTIDGDTNGLKQVFLNLLENAVKYAQPGGQITVSLRRKAEGIACTVSDNGPGIPAEHLPHLARRFYRVAPQRTEGSGLGLAIVTEILRRHRSSMEIKSYTEGDQRGTHVHFTLPLLSKEEGLS